MILSDVSITKAIKSGDLSIKPFRPECVQPSSVDLHLGAEFLLFKHSKHPVIDVKKSFEGYTEKMRVKKGEAFIVHPDEFILGVTAEKVKIPNYLVGRLEGKSSLGRLGIITHATAGFVDPGFEGKLTLEISNVGKIPVALYPGMRIAQISFILMTTPAAKPYGTVKNRNKYQNARGPEESKIHRDYFK